VVSVEDIAAVPIFSSLDADQLATIANWFDAEDVGEGVKLVGEGCHGYSFFVLAEGTASVTAEGEELATLRAGDFFGEVAMLDSGRRTASVTSTAPARSWSCSGPSFVNCRTPTPRSPTASRSP
jgi:CRP-like cAMP-binding protein